MIGQYLSNINEKATVLILQNILELNKALLFPTMLTLDGYFEREGRRKMEGREYISPLHSCSILSMKLTA